jgi:hypothetical protein
MERLGPRIQDGYIWITTLGTLPGDHAKRRVAEGAVVVRVTQGGDAYEVLALTSSGPTMLEQHTSTNP